MKTMLWLIRREYSEHRGMLFWSPLIVALAIIVLAAIGVVTGIGAAPAGDKAYQQLPTEDKVRLILNTAFMLSFAPMLAMQAITLFFYSLSSLVDERKDRSILFWKSLPLSDRTTVFSKIITALFCVPMLTFVVALAATVMIIAMMCLALLFKGTNLFSAVLATPTLYLFPMHIIGLLPVYILWALPTIGWLFMVSSWVRSNFFLWATGVPILAISILKVSTIVYNLHWGSDWFIDNVLLRALIGFVPGAWSLAAHTGTDTLLNNHQAIDLSQLFSDAWKIVGSSSMWLGVIAGSAMICNAIRLRQLHVEA